MNGSSNINGREAGVVLVSLDDFRIRYGLKFSFKASNNTVEYEAIITGLELASTLKIKDIKILSDSQFVVNQINENSKQGKST